jgi:hypothetical protein
MSPFTLQHMPLLADDLPRGRAPAGPPDLAGPAAASSAAGPIGLTAGPDGPTPGLAALPPGAPGVLQLAAGLALVLAGGLFIAVLALPAYVAAIRAARAHPDIRAAMAAAIAAEDD